MGCFLEKHYRNLTPVFPFPDIFHTISDRLGYVARTLYIKHICRILAFNHKPEPGQLDNFAILVRTATVCLDGINPISGSIISHHHSRCQLGAQHSVLDPAGEIKHVILLSGQTETDKK